MSLQSEDSVVSVERGLSYSLLLDAPDSSGPKDSEDVPDKAKSKAKSWCDKWCCCCSTRRRLTWCCALTIFLFVTAFLIFYFVVAPRMAAKALRDSTVTFSAVAVTEPTLDSCYLTASAKMKNPSALGAHMDSSTLHVYLLTKNGTQLFIGNVQLPPLSVSAHSTADVDMRTLFIIQNMDGFNAFGRSLVFEDAVEWRLTGSVTVRSFGITLHDIPLDKVVTLGGCGGLRDVQLEVFDVSRSTPEDVIVDLTVSVNNPSVFSISPLGTLKFNMYYGSAFMGTLLAPNVSLTVGQNVYNMSGVLKPDNLTQASVLFSRYLRGATSVVDAVAADDASSIPLFNSALQGLPLMTILQPSPIPLIDSVSVSSMSVSPLDPEHVTITTSLGIHITNPLGPNSPIQVISTSVSSSAFAPNGDTLGSLDLSNVAPSSIVAHGASVTFGLDIIDATMSLEGNGSAFGMFASELLQAGPAGVGMKLDGTATAVVSCALGTLTVTDQPLVSTLQLEGLGGLSSAKILSWSMPSAVDGGGANIEANAEIMNPSFVSFNVSDIAVDVYAPILSAECRGAEPYPELGTLMGRLTIPQMNLQPGRNVLAASGVVFPSYDDAIMAQFFSCYLGGVDTLVTLEAVNLENHPIWLRPALRSLRVHGAWPGFEGSLISTVAANSMSIVPLDAASVLMGADLRVVMENPLGAAIPIQVKQTSLSSTAFDAQSLATPLATLHVSGVDPSSIVNGPSSIDMELRIDGVPMQLSGDGSAFGDFAAKLFQSSPTQGVDMFLGGTVDAFVTCALGNLSLSGLPLNNTIHLPGLGGLSVADIISWSLPESAAGGGVVLQASAAIENPSLVSINVSDISFDVYAPVISVPTCEEAQPFPALGSLLGSLTIPNMDISPGRNVLSTTGVVQPPAITDNIDAYFSCYLSGANTTVTMMASNIDQQPVWLRAVLSILRVHGRMSGLPQPFQFLTSANFTSAYISFFEPSAGHDQGSVMLAGAATGGMQSPFGFAITPLNVSMVADIIYEGQAVSRMTLPWLPVQTEPVAPDSSNDADHYRVGVSFAFSSTPLSILDENGFVAFATQMFQQPSVEFEIRASASAIADSPMGRITVYDLASVVSSALPGLKNLVGDLVSNKFEIIGGRVDGLDVLMDLQVTNPSLVGMGLGAISVSTLYNNVEVANGTLTDMALAGGTSTSFTNIPIRVVQIDGETGNTTMLAQFMSRFTMLESSTVTIKAEPSRCPIPLLRPVLSAFSATMSMPGLKAHLMSKCEMDITYLDYVKLFLGTSHSIETHCWLINPYPVEVSLTGALLRLTTPTPRMDLGYFDIPNLAVPVVLGPTLPGQDPVPVATRDLPVSVRTIWNTHLMEAFWQELTSGHTTFDVSGQVSFSIGDFHQTIDYEQDNGMLLLSKP